MCCKFKTDVFHRVWSVKRAFIACSSIGIIFWAVLIALTCTGCAPTTEQLRTQKQGQVALAEARRQAEEAWKKARRSDGLVGKEIQVDGDRIVYLEGGRGEIVLLLHGFGCNKDMWVDFARLLTAAYHVVIPDLPGFGESTKKWGENYNIESQVKRLARFTEVLHMKRLHLAGNSMGGAIAAVYAAKYPQKIKTLALLDTYGLQTAKWTQLWSQVCNGHNIFLVRNPEDFEKLLSYVYVTPPQIPVPIKRVIVDEMIADSRLDEQISSQLYMEAVPLESFLPMIQAPVMIIWGDHDRIFDVSSVRILEEGLKNHQTLIIKDVGHVPMVEKPAETATGYINFLKNRQRM